MKILKYGSICFILLATLGCGSTAPSGTSTVFYTIYDDGTASVANNQNYGLKEVIISDYVDYEGKKYRVTSINTDAFKQNPYIEKVTFPNTLKNIGWDAFYACKNLKEVDLGPSLETIGDHVFANCTSLEKIEGGESVTSLYKGVFENTSLKEVTLNKIEKMDINCFWNNPKLEKVTLNGTYTSLPGSSFERCPNLKEVQLTSLCTEIENYAFKNCPSLATFDFSNINIIGNYAFENCGFAELDLKNVELGNGAFIQNQALSKVSLDTGTTSYKSFSGSINLKEVLLKNVSVIASQTFSNCHIKKLTFDYTLKRIESEAFINNPLETLTFPIPSTIEAIHRKAFYNTSLKGTLVLPHSLKKIYAYAFSNTKLDHIEIYQETEYEENSFDDLSKINTYNINYDENMSK